MGDHTRVVLIHPDAPPQPALGAPCNGCGVCCLSEPCPVGMLVSRRRRGACAALRWHEAEARYQCGLLADAQQPLWRWWLRRWIAAGVGCDATLETERAP